MTKKELERKLESIENILIAQNGALNMVLTIPQAEKRDYIVRNKYIGKITDKKIKEDFKTEIEKECGDKFESITNKILNYEFYFENKNILNKFSKTLEKYEYKQIVLDTYGDKKNEK